MESREQSGAGRDFDEAVQAEADQRERGSGGKRPLHVPKRSLSRRFSCSSTGVVTTCALPLADYQTLWLSLAPRVNYKMMLKWTDVLKLAKGGNPPPERKVVKTQAEWREQLSDEEYHVSRQAGTERAFSSEMCSLFESGIHSCLCCETVLFDASEKFESHTGWPSFTQPIKGNVIAYRFDGPAFLKRVETICNTCDAHLGHVFPDGPPPSGPRYCMNAVALQKFGVVRPDADA